MIGDLRGAVPFDQAVLRLGAGIGGNLARPFRAADRVEQAEPALRDFRGLGFDPASSCAMTATRSSRAAIWRAAASRRCVQRALSSFTALRRWLRIETSLRNASSAARASPV